MQNVYNSLYSWLNSRRMMKKRLKVEAIVPLAGLGTRLKTKQTKPFVLLKNRPLFFYAVSVLEKSPWIDQIILVSHESFLETFQRWVKRFQFKKVKAIVPGGEFRQQSVYQGLQQVDQDTDIVLVHDGARPFISADIIEKSIQMCRRKKAVITAVPIKPTIKKVSRQMQVIETIPREDLWEVQTPQVFTKDLLRKAHQRGRKYQATDDAFLVEKLGIKVSVCQGNYDNIKITTKEDLDIAKVILARK